MKPSFVRVFVREVVFIKLCVDAVFAFEVVCSWTCSFCSIVNLIVYAVFVYEVVCFERS